MIEDAKIMGVYGGRGQGKSTYVKEHVGDYARVIVFDPMDEYVREKGFSRAENLQQVIEQMKKGKGQQFRIAYVPPASIEPDLALHELCLLVLRVQEPYKAGKSKAQILLIVEELSKSAPNEKLRKGRRGFIEVIDRGRHSGVSVLGTSQRVKSILLDFRSNSASEVFFNIFDHSEIVHIEAKMTPEHRGKIANLQPHHYLKHENGQIFYEKNKLASLHNVT